MREQIIRFIRENEKLIDQEDWKTLYAKAKARDSLSTSTGELTEVLIAAGLNPLEKLEEVPALYLCESTQISEIDIPEGIKSIAGLGLYNARHLTRISIPKSCTYFGILSFAYCNAALYAATSLVIEYAGTRKEWDLIDKHPQCRLPKLYILKCSDIETTERTNYYEI